MKLMSILLYLIKLFFWCFKHNFFSSFIVTFGLNSVLTTMILYITFVTVISDIFCVFILKLFVADMFSVFSSRGTDPKWSAVLIMKQWLYLELTGYFGNAWHACLWAVCSWPLRNFYIWYNICPRHYDLSGILLCINIINTASCRPICSVW